MKDVVSKLQEGGATLVSNVSAASRNRKDCKEGQNYCKQEYSTSDNCNHVPKNFL
jgi:hypothetical protein